MQNSLVKDLAAALGMEQQYLENKPMVDAVTDVIKKEAVAEATEKSNIQRSFSNYKQALFARAGQ